MQQALCSRLGDILSAWYRQTQFSDRWHNGIPWNAAFSSLNSCNSQNAVICHWFCSRPLTVAIKGVISLPYLSIEYPCLACSLTAEVQPWRLEPSYSYLHHRKHQKSALRQLWDPSFMEIQGWNCYNQDQLSEERRWKAGDLEATLTSGHPWCPIIASEQTEIMPAAINFPCCPECMLMSGCPRWDMTVPGWRQD